MFNTQKENGRKVPGTFSSEQCLYKFCYFTALIGTANGVLSDSWGEFDYPVVKNVSPIRTPILIQGRLERTETNLMHFKWKVT